MYDFRVSKFATGRAIIIIPSRIEAIIGVADINRGSSRETGRSHMSAVWAFLLRHGVRRTRSTSNEYRSKKFKMCHMGRSREGKT